MAIFLSQWFLLRFRCRTCTSKVVHSLTHIHQEQKKILDRLEQIDVIVLEFESPVLPDELRVLRSPAAEKPKKGEGGGKEKGGKKKK